MLVVAAAAIVLCCCLAAAGAIGLSTWIAVRSSPDLSDPQPPPPPANVLRRPPALAERDTASLISRTVLPQRDLVDLAQRLKGVPSTLDGKAVLDPPAPAVPAVGSPGAASETFWIHDADTTSYFTATATLALATPHAYWWVEEGFDVPEDDLERSARTFEDGTYPTTRRYFGSEWTPGVDGDPRIYIFLGAVPGVGGYFAGHDEVRASISPYSNEHEIFYINLDNAMPGNDYFDGILAHEFQHMIHWYVDRNEDTWVNEGLSELSAHLNGFEVGSLEGVFSRQPETQLTGWPEIEHSAAHYGASYLFMRYFVERAGEAAVRQLVAEPADGMAGLDAVLSSLGWDEPRSDRLFADWLAANYLDNPHLADGRYGYAGLDVRRPAHAAEHDDLPVLEQATVHQYAADYILIEGESPATIEFTGSLLVPLLGNETHSGQYQWWSKRGDEGDSTLTRAFDLSGLERATLQAWMWYHLETDYDYAYVEVSADGGDTWTILSNDHTVTGGSTGSSYGPGFTGPSGGVGSAQPIWTLETFDLSPYAGRQVLLRFEVVTDDTIHYPGLALDDISITELGYADDVESGNGEWQAQGWARVTSLVPQEFVVQLLTLGRTPQVMPVELDESLRGNIALSGLGSEFDRAVLVVAGVTPATTEWASYSYRIRPLQ